MEQSMQEKLAQLRAPLPSKSIAWRVGAIKADKTKGQALPYLTPRVIQDLLDTVIGAENWRNSFVSSPLGENASLTATLEILVNGHWVGKSDGAHLDTFSDVSNQKEKAIKGAYGDAFKRAAVMWGIGRYLYDFSMPWVDLNENQYLASTPRLPAHLLPETEQNAAKASTSSSSATNDTKELVVPVAAPAARLPEAKPEPVAEKPAAVKAPETAAVVASEPTSTPAVADEDAARERSAAAVDAELASRTKPPATPVTMAATSPSNDAGDVPNGMPEGLSDEQLKTVKGLIEKIKKKLPTAMLRNYVKGPKATEALPESARMYVLALLDEADNNASKV